MYESDRSDEDGNCVRMYESDRSDEGGASDDGSCAVT